MRKLIFALALGAILLPNHGFTLGLGEIEVSSSLNQTLAARIDLISAIPEDAETLIVKLASREEFVRAGLDRPQIVTTLKFKTVVENGRVYIDVMTPKPIREPFLNFLVEVDWPKGHLIREYTILLDPPVFMGQNGFQKSAPAATPAMQAAVAAAPVGVQSAATAASGTTAAAPVAAGAYAPAVATQQTAYAPSDYRIQQGDTAWSIANKMRPDASVSTQQMLMALLRANPEVFINENVNGLKRGYILRMPDQADITALSSEEARDSVRQQNALWREYQQSMASDQPASAIEDGSADSEYRSAVSSGNGSRLAIVSAGAGASASGEMKDPSEMTASELREQLALARERVETERVEKETLQKQVSSLATQVDKMKGLIAIEDDVMAEMQAAESAAGETPLVLDADVEEAVEETDFEQSAEDSLAALEALTGESQSADEQPAVTDEATQELFVDPAEQAVEMEAVTEQDMPVGLEPDYAPPQEAGLIDALLNNKMIVGGLLIVLLVIGAIAYLIKRRRDNASGEVTSSDDKAAFNPSDEHALEDVADMIDDESIDDLVSDEQMAASMAEAEAEEEAFDAEATMILPSGTGTVVTTAASLQPEEEEEQDDVMAEADVYLAYGIYQQAEELLQNAIKEHPEKDSYRVKLAETYFAGKNAEAFAKLGAEMKQRLGNAETPAWLKVVAMGKELCPEAEVFQQASVAADLDINDLMPKSPEPMDFDLGEVDDGAADLDLDFDVPLEESADEISFDLPAMDMDETAILSSDNSASSLDELEFDLSETDAIKAAPAEEEFSLDISAAELDLDTGLDFDMSMDATPEAAEAESDAGLDFDMSMDDLGGTDNAEAVEFDLSDEAAAQDMADELDMNVDAADLGLSMEDDLGDMDLLDAADVDEVNTKLDLAKAYLDMGDHEGARDILDEVMAGGNAQQKKEAQELLAQAK